MPRGEALGEDSACVRYLDGAVSGIIAASAGEFGVAVVLLPLDSANGYENRKP
ncbi:hypothetical protein LJR267_010104 [Paraburkholderia hospita]|jgi:hypothetical protein|uniref:hypothetical protein n=1 Tax=Paraburkholderia hospita TaxID=169430 RepID=UPI003ECF735A